MRVRRTQTQIVTFDNVVTVVHIVLSFLGQCFHSWHVMPAVSLGSGSETRCIAAHSSPLMGTFRRKPVQLTFMHNNNSSVYA